MGQPAMRRVWTLVLLITMGSLSLLVAFSSLAPLRGFHGGEAADLGSSWEPRPCDSVPWHQRSATAASRAQFGQDLLLIERYFKSQCDCGSGGSVVEVGGFDGFHDSNSYLLEQRCGWRALLVEPNAELAKMAASNRPRAVVVRAAVGPLSAPPNATAMLVSHQRWQDAGIGGLLGVVNATKAFSAHRRDNISEDIAKGSAVEVPVIALGKLLQQYAFQAIDLLSVDCEGCEYSLLSGIDWQQTRVRMVLVEMDPTSNSEGSARVDAFLRHRGFVTDHAFHALCRKGSVHCEDQLYVLPSELPPPPRDSPP